MPIWLPELRVKQTWPNRAGRSQFDPQWTSAWSDREAVRCIHHTLLVACWSQVVALRLDRELQGDA
jgi:hypothetical protein